MAGRIVTGLDIGDSSIKAAVVTTRETPPKLLAIGTANSPSPGITSDSDLDLEAVSLAIKNLIAEINPPNKDAVLSLPESKVFTRVVYDLPFLTDEELAQAIRFAAEEFVPMPIPDVNLNYQVIFRSPGPGPKSHTVVFVVASPKALIDKYLRVAAGADLRVLAIETELIAAARSVVGFNAFSPPTLLVQMGSNTTDFAVVVEGLLLLTRSIATGGMALTRAVSQTFNFEMVQAEEYKKVYGLVKDRLEGKLYQTIQPVVDVILGEAKRVVQSYEAQNTSKLIKRVVLSGGGAKLPGLVVYFAINLGLEVQEADPYLAIAKDSKIKSKLTVGGSGYSIAIGLALRQD